MADHLMPPDTGSMDPTTSEPAPTYQSPNSGNPQIPSQSRSTSMQPDSKMFSPSPSLPPLPQEHRQQRNGAAMSSQPTSANIQRSPPLSLVNQIQKQYCLMRQQQQQGGLYGFGGPREQNNQQQQLQLNQQQMVSGNMAGSALMGPSEHLPMLSSTTAATQLNLPSQMLSSVWIRSPVSSLLFSIALSFL